MGIIETIIEFLSGRKKGAAGRPDFAQAQKIASDELALKEKGLSEFASLKFAEIKHLISRLSKSAAYLDSQKIDLSAGNEALRRIVSTSQKNLARQLKGLSQKLAPPAAINPDSVREYCSRAMQAIANDLMPYWKNIALAKILLKDEVKEIGDNLKELALAIEVLGAKCSDAKTREFTRLAVISERISSASQLAQELESKAASGKKDLAAAQAEHSSLSRSLEEKKGSPQASQLIELDSQIREFESKKEEVVSRLNSALAPLEKVLKRLAPIAESGDALTARENEVLALMLENPAGMIISDPKGEVARQVFSKAKELVQKGSISLKDSEKQKRLDGLDALIAKDFFSEYFWEMNRAQAELAQAQKERAGLTLSSEIGKLEASLASAKKRLEEAKSGLERAQGELALNASKESALREEFAALFNSVFRGGPQIAEK